MKEITPETLMLATGVLVIGLMVVRQLTMLYLNIRYKRKFIEGINEILSKKMRTGESF